MEIRNGNVPLNVAVDGPAGGPAVVLLHGITSSIRTWDWMVPALAERYRVIRLDFRGHGGSGRTPDHYGFEDYLSDAVAVCEQVAGGSCTVVGHSLGGGTAAGLAQRHPELVTAIALEDPPLVAARETTPPVDSTLMDAFRLMRTTIPELQASGIPLETLAEVLGRAPSGNGTPYAEVLHQDALVSMAAGMLDVDATVLDPVLESRMEPVFDPSQPIPVPTLVLPADPASPDAVARPEHIEQLVSRTPHAEVRVMAGSGHLVHDELAQRDTFLEEVRSFLDRVAG
jgi:pimeloyl-ACP methyl ester carboxylesterase